MKETEYIPKMAEGNAGNMKYRQAWITNLDSLHSVTPDYVTYKRKVLLLTTPS